jgi:hypothetical protein
VQQWRYREGEGEKEVEKRKKIEREEEEEEISPLQSCSASATTDQWYGSGRIGAAGGGVTR